MVMCKRNYGQVQRKLANERNFFFSFSNTGSISQQYFFLSFCLTSMLSHSILAELNGLKLVHFLITKKRIKINLSISCYLFEANKFELMLSNQDYLRKVYRLQICYEAIIPSFFYSSVVSEFMSMPFAEVLFFLNGND